MALVNWFDSTPVGTKKVEATLTAENTFSDEFRIKPGTFFNVKAEGTFVGTVTLQWQFDGTGTFEDYASDDKKWAGTFIHDESFVIFRIGFKTGDFTSGSVNVRISQ